MAYSEKKYFIGIDGADDHIPWGTNKFESYHEAVVKVKELNEITGGNIGYKIFKIETKVSKADHVTEDYWEQG